MMLMVVMISLTTADHCKLMMMMPRIEGEKAIVNNCKCILNDDEDEEEEDNDDDDDCVDYDDT